MNTTTTLVEYHGGCPEVLQWWEFIEELPLVLLWSYLG
jgi:hypothetical protein